MAKIKIETMDDQSLVLSLLTTVAKDEATARCLYSDFFAGGAEVGDEIEIRWNAEKQGIEVIFARNIDGLPAAGRTAITRAIGFEVTPAFAACF